MKLPAPLYNAKPYAIVLIGCVVSSLGGMLFLLSGVLFSSAGLCMLYARMQNRDKQIDIWKREVKRRSAIAERLKGTGYAA